MDIEEAKDGSRVHLSRALTLIENGLRFESQAPGFVIGITGAPGVGKSCLVDQLAREYASRGEKIAILAVDPSSPITGGALLGDRLRMDSADHEDLIYMRSVATRGEAGAVPGTVEDMSAFLRECGWQRIIIETVGSGQAEIRIAAVADSILLVEAPGMGDSIQSEKAGIIELVDIIAVNKSDLPGADATATDIMNALSAGSMDIPVTLVSANTGDGVCQLIEVLEKSTRRNMTRAKWRERLAGRWMKRMTNHSALEDILDSLESGNCSIDEALSRLEESS